MQISAEEMALFDDRKRELYMSKWTIDNLTAIMMDSDKGGTGLHESTARAKAHGVFDWLSGFIVQAKIPQKHE